MALHDWQTWFDPDMEPHHLIVEDDQEIYVRRFIYSLIGKRGMFVLHFDDLKFSTPFDMVAGDGFVKFKEGMIWYSVKKNKTILKSNDRELLVKFVCAAIDEFIP
ncbi:hypothetical protein FK949_gp225 [Paramecium bursaria Chlorella virus NYs1]|uniref:Uncharacterized protein n=1 Tax=Paramecium bursaria Chlorella virus NYs1 TaxID=83442 RepID=M1IK53_9PHYC|nr:hypothetical protein FK949_gp225 [Paramecium bursaria Chlorella virus NYs1]AGE55083.1 hypothetical protein PBCVMA1D_827R [Paramecium bursaria Chlorella virus MA1D]AGE58900.1 hypothetical protein PBCVNYs1_835R [Paramecium bursaria Chlorella virus NYs1]